jgi:branched-chain amino acid aminotransferase
MTPFQLFAIEDAGPRPLPIPDDATQFPDLYRGLPLGVYTALRTFEHYKFLYLNRHLARTERSMALLSWSYALDRARLLRALHAVVTAAEWPEMRVRLDILAGPAETLGTMSRELIALQAFKPPPPELYERGVVVDFAERLSRPNPLAKTADFAAARPATGGLMGRSELLATRDESQETTDDGQQATAGQTLAGASPVVPYEFLLIDDQRRILEGTGTNFWAVRGGVLYTAGQGVLEGITREIILRLAPELGIEVRLEAVGADEIATLDEAALSGSSRAFLPVVEIAGTIVGDGRPGLVSGCILSAYQAFVAENIRPAI